MCTIWTRRNARVNLGGAQLWDTTISTRNRPFARAHLSPHPFDPLSLRERGNSVRPSSPLSTSWRGGQGVRTNESERACHPERRRREGPAFRERRTTAGPSSAGSPHPRSARKQVLRSRALRALGPHPLSPSPHMRRGGTKGQSR